MTAVRPGVPSPSPSAGDAPLVPASCRVSILVGDSHQIDLVLPSAVPLSALTDATRDAASRVLRTRGDDELARGSYEFSPGGGHDRAGPRAVAGRPGRRRRRAAGAGSRRDRAALWTQHRKRLDRARAVRAGAFPGRVGAGRGRGGRGADRRSVGGGRCHRVAAAVGQRRQLGAPGGVRRGRGGADRHCAGVLAHSRPTFRRGRHRLGRSCRGRTGRGHRPARRASFCPARVPRVPGDDRRRVDAGPVHRAASDGGRSGDHGGGGRVRRCDGADVLQRARAAHRDRDADRRAGGRQGCADDGAVDGQGAEAEFRLDHRARSVRPRTRPTRGHGVPGRVGRPRRDAARRAGRRGGAAVQPGADRDAAGRRDGGSWCRRGSPSRREAAVSGRRSPWSRSSRSFWCCGRGLFETGATRSRWCARRRCL